MAMTLSSINSVEFVIACARVTVACSESELTCISNYYLLMNVRLMNAFQVVRHFRTVVRYQT
jgi:hypothetical protein